MLEVKEVSSLNKKLYKQFIDYPNKLYADCPYYIPYTFGDEILLLDTLKNPSFAHCKGKFFLCYKDGVIVGRIGGLINYIYNEKSGKNYMRITRFDFINDLEVCRTLLNCVEQFAKDEGMNIVHGPFGFHDLDREGILINKGFDLEATLATNYNYSYYQQLIEQCGYTEENLWLEHQVDIPDKIPEKVIRVSKLATEIKKLRLVNEKSTIATINKYARGVLDVYDEAYAVLPGAIPLTEQVRKQVIAQFKIMINKRYLSLVVTEDDYVVAFAFGMSTIGRQLRKCKGKPNLFTLLSILHDVRKPTKIEMGLVGVRSEWRNSGALALVMLQMFESLKQDGIKQIQSNPELLTNVNVRSIWNDYDFVVVKERATYVKNI